MNIDVGSVVGDYQVIGLLGAGGMGKVFKVRNVISDRIEAMKVLLPDLAGEPDLADRFLREIKVLASLSHPNIAGLHTALRFENQLLMLMELVEGVTLEERLRQAPLSVAEAVDCIGQVLAALSYAHQHGVTHRDIKPANMMLTANGVVKLMDFGIAKSAADRRLTMTGTTMGSLYYMSPEQIRGVQTLDSRSDLYSVGVSLYELVTGKRPFDGESQFSIMSAHLETDPVPPITIQPHLPPALNEIILLSVQREPDKRFQSADAFRNALLSVGAAPDAGRVAVSAAAIPSAPPPPVSKSHRGLWLAMGSLCAVAAIVAVAEFAPFKKASAGAPAASAVAAPPAAVSTPPPSAPAPVVEPPKPVPPEPAPQSPRKPAIEARAAAPRVERRVAAVQSATPPVQTPAQAPAQPPPQVQAPVVSPPAQSAPAPDLRAKRAELQKVREALVKLSARAAALHSTLQNLQRSQAASGLGLRSDWVQAASLMDSFLKGSSDALNAGDTEAAQDFLTKAEFQVEKLESALH